MRKFKDFNGLVSWAANRRLENVDCEKVEAINVGKRKDLEIIRNQIIAIFKERGEDPPKCDEDFENQVEDMEEKGDKDGKRLRELSNTYDEVQYA